MSAGSRGAVDGPKRTKRVRSPGRAVELGFVLLLAIVAPASAAAQLAQQEEPDPTRLDVERLPPEAIELQRSMYSEGPYMEARLGGLGFAGGVGRVSRAGFLTHVALGYELTQWLALAVAGELSFHSTNAPAPPSPSAFQVISTLVSLRLQLPLSARAALWLAPEGGFGWVSGQVLSTYDLPDATDPGLTYGGSLGFDWHMKNRHHSLGLMVGGRRYTNLENDLLRRAFGLQAALYLKYVF